MSLPILKRPWLIDENRVGASSQTVLECHQRTLFEVKDSLINLTSPWSVVSSSNGTTSSSSDNWSSFSNLVWGTSSFSWIVLKHPVWALEILISLNDTDSSLLSFSISYGGNFTGGSTSANPTASDENIVIDKKKWIGTDSSAFNSWVHTWQSKDGYDNNMVLVVTSEGEGKGMFWSFDKPSSSSFLWANKQLSLIAFQTDSTINSVLDINEMMKTDADPNPGEVYSLDSTISFCGSPLKDPTINLFSKKSTRFNLRHEEGTALTVLDRSRNFYNGTITGNPTLSTDTPGGGLSKNSMSFPGGVDFISMGNVAELNFDLTDSFSFSFWAKWTTTNAVVLSKQVPGGTFRGYQLSVGATVTFVLRNANPGNRLIVDTINNTYNDNNWHHVAVTYTYNGSGDAKIYVDGVLDTTVFTNTLTGSTTTTESFIISGRGTTPYMNGLVDDVAVFNKELTLDEVNLIYNNGIPSDLRASNLNDDLIAYWLAEPPDQYVTMGNAAALDFTHTEAFSVSCWFRCIPRTPFTTAIVSKKTIASTLQGYSINMIDPSNPEKAGAIEIELINDITTNNSIILESSQTFGDGEWHHLTMTYDGSALASGVSLYVDDQLISLTVINDNLSATISNSAPFQISGFDGGNRAFIGSIADVAVFDKELSSSEVSSIYRNGNPPDITLLSVNSNLVGYWYMGDSDTHPTIQDRSSNSNDGTMTNMSSSSFLADSPANPLLFFKLGGRNLEVETNTDDQFTRRTALGTANELGSTKLPITPIHFVSGYGYQGLHGYLTDIFWGTDAFDADPGNTYPNNADLRQLAQYHHVIFPWTKGSELPLFGIDTSQPHNTFDGSLTEIDANSFKSRIKFYQMIGIDSGSSSQPSYISWTSDRIPDSNGLLVTPPDGGPVTDIHVSHEWSGPDRNPISDFTDIPGLIAYIDPRNVPNGTWPNGKDSLGNTLSLPFVSGSGGGSTSYPSVSNEVINFTGTSRHIFHWPNIDINDLGNESTAFMVYDPATGNQPLVNQFPITDPRYHSFSNNNLVPGGFWTYGTSILANRLDWTALFNEQRLILLKTNSQFLTYRNNVVIAGPVSNTNSLSTLGKLCFGVATDFAGSTFYYTGTLKIFGIYDRGLQGQELNALLYLLSEL